MMFKVYILSYIVSNVVLHGLVVRIPGFHPGGPGSIPGVGIFLILLSKTFIMKKLRNSVWFINLR